MNVIESIRLLHVTAMTSSSGDVESTCESIYFSEYGHGSAKGRRHAEPERATTTRMCPIRFDDDSASGY